MPSIAAETRTCVLPRRRRRTVSPARGRSGHRQAASENDTGWCSPARSATAKLPASRHARQDAPRFRERSSLPSASNTTPQQLRLPKLVFAETAAVRRQDPLGHLQGHSGKRQESHFGHRPSCFLREHSLPSSVENSNRKLCRGCQQSRFKSNVLELLIPKSLQAFLWMCRLQRS